MLGDPIPKSPAPCPHSAPSCRHRALSHIPRYATSRGSNGNWVGQCYISITHVNSVSISVYHVTICQQTPFRDARQLTTILSSSLCSLRHSSEILRATLKSYLMSLLFGHHQWISVRGPNNSFGNQTGKTSNSSKTTEAKRHGSKPLVSRVG